MHKFYDTDIWIYVSAGRYYLAECNKQFPRFLLWFQKLNFLNEEWWSAIKKRKQTKMRVKRKKRKTKKLKNQGETIGIKKQQLG